MIELFNGIYSFLDNRPPVTFITPSILITTYVKSLNNTFEIFFIFNFLFDLKVILIFLNYIERLKTTNYNTVFVVFWVFSAFNSTITLRSMILSFSYQVIQLFYVFTRV